MSARPHMEPPQRAKIANGASHFLVFKRWATLLLPSFVRIEDISLGRLAGAVALQRARREVDRGGDLGLLGTHPKEKICDPINQELPTFQFGPESFDGIAIRWSWFHGQHLAKRFLANQAIVHQLGEYGLHFRCKWTVTPSRVVQSRR